MLLFSHSVTSDCNPTDYTTPGFPVFHYLSFLKFMFIGSVMLPNHLIPYCPLFLWPSSFPSNWIFSNKGSSYRCSIYIWWMNKHFEIFIIPIFCTNYSLLWTLKNYFYSVVYLGFCNPLRKINLNKRWEKLPQLNLICRYKIWFFISF